MADRNTGDHETRLLLEAVIVVRPATVLRRHGAVWRLGVKAFFSKEMGGGAGNRTLDTLGGYT
jgi:hypothetical protein